MLKITLYVGLAVFLALVCVGGLVDLASAGIGQ